MKPGAILVEHASRSYRVHPKPVRTLKDLVVSRGRTPGTDVWALRDVSLAVEPGESVGLIGRNGSGKTTLLRLLAGIIRPSTGRVAAAGRVGSLLELGAAFHPEFTGRENVYLNGSIYGLKRRYIDEQLDEIVAFAELERFIDLPVRTYSSGMYMRLGFAIAAHLDADILLLDEVFAVGDEAFQRKCFGRVFAFKQRGGTIVFVSHEASSVERLCERAVLLREGRVDFDGATHEAVSRYHYLLASEHDPEERRGGLREWGSGEAHITSCELLGAEGAARTQFLSGEPVTLRLTVAAEPALEPPRVSYELRDERGLLLASGSQDTAELGWSDTRGRHAVLFELDRLPLTEGRFQLRFGLSDSSGARVYHWLDDALRFVVYPESDERGPVRLEGVWRTQEIEAGAELNPR